MCACGVVCGVGGVCVVVLWWCVCVVCGEAWHTLSLALFSSLFRFFLLSLFFSLLFLFLSVAPSLALALVISLFLLSPLLATNQPTRRPTSRHLNVIWRRASALQSVPSLLPSPPPLLKNKKEEGTFFITGIFPARNLFFVTVLNKFQKTRRRGKLQSLQFYNSKTIGL